MTAVRSLFVFALTGWIGSVLFYSLVVLPVLFLKLAPPQAGTVAALIFPFYYRMGSVLGILLLVAAGCHAARYRGGWRWATGLVALMLACQVYATVVVHPRMQALRGNEQRVGEFQTLHRRSVRLNGIVLAGGLALIVASGSLLGNRSPET